MSFDDDWQAIHTAANQPGNTAPGPNGFGPNYPAAGAAGTQKHSEQGKKAAGRRLQEHLRPETKKAGDKADESTGKTTKTFTDWETGSALRKRHTRWEQNVKKLMERLAEEETGLQSANAIVTDNDDLTARMITKGEGPGNQSKLNQI